MIARSGSSRVFRNLATVAEQSNFASSFLDCLICPREHLSQMVIVIADPAAAERLSG
jgi:hypothetical protein